MFSLSMINLKNMDKDTIIKLIENRILSEHRKHSKSLPDDWAKIAAHKIFASLSESKTITND